MKKYSFVLTLQFPMGGMNHAVLESSGVVELEPGFSRNDFFQQARTNMIDSARGQGVTGNPTTIFFDLAPDAL